MSAKLFGVATSMLVIAALVAGCGSSGSSSSGTGTNSAASPAATTKTESDAKDKGADKDKDKDADAGPRTACKGPATSKASDLPAHFPTPAELVLTKFSKDGPTNLADGYWRGDLDGTYTALQAQVKQAGFELTHTEKDEHDAEINYQGSGRSGQVALHDNCSESETTRVHVTSRPA
ncbi:MAG: hypothetical protein JWM71_1282 [Solirubrobacteraceae bacterium]|nr:hypothetical protein [Solirubrobacteraceae bacterium]